MNIVQSVIEYLPLWALAGSAVFYVWNTIKELENKQRERFFNLMNIIDSKDLPLASKTAAIYHLRFYPKHALFISRFCGLVQKSVNGPSSETLVNELKLTKEYMDRRGPPS
jgi:hypothetical protein